MIRFKIKRVYDAAEESDGLRVLVDKLWPRGVKKSDLKYDLWAKTISPSDALRKMFHEDPERNWEEFARRYEAELEQSHEFSAFAERIKQLAPSTVTLLFAFRNAEKNHAFVLKCALEKQFEAH